MIPYRASALLFFLFLCVSVRAQLGFCPGSKGEPIFTENFGNGTTYGPQLPAGITTYTFIPGAPQDGQYTLFNNAYQFTTWHNTPDHTPDASNGANGKMLLVNANAVQSGDFYKRTVSGLCTNTTFEFSAWVMNVYNPSSNYCGAGQIPINVRFEIWNSTETVLLGSGNTGNIMGSPSPLWQQFALVFTTVSETSVVLKMKNNGLGGCGNDLAIDDISFSACGDLTTISSPSVSGESFTTCTNPVTMELHAATAGAIPYFYQWQTSTDGSNWTDIPGGTNATYSTPNLSALTYFRVRAAQDAANLANTFCSAISNVFTVNVLPNPSAPANDGDKAVCGSQVIPPLTVTVPAGTGVNWYDAATGGTLLQNGNTYTPTAGGTFYAEAYDLVTNCTSGSRTPVSLTVSSNPDATISGTTTICNGGTAVISFNGTPNATVTYNLNGGPDLNIILNASGQAGFTTPALSTAATYNLVSVASGISGSCTQTLSGSVTVSVGSALTASISGPASVCSGSGATITFSGTPDAVVTYTVDGGTNQTVSLNASGSALVSIASVSADTSYELIQVDMAGTASCPQPLSQTLTIVAVPMPAVSISANPSVICYNQSGIIVFAGTPNAAVTYKVGTGANQLVTLDGSGAANVVTPNLTADTTYTLLSVASPILNSCVTVTSGSVTIAVNDLPTVAISGDALVCSGASAVLQFFGTPNATVTFTLNGSIQTLLLDAAGNATFTTAPISAPISVALVDVTSSGAITCTQALSQTWTVGVVPTLAATIAATPASVCSGQSGTLHFTGTPNASVIYNSGGSDQSVLLDATGNASVTTSGIFADATFQLVGITMPGSGCSAVLSGSATITVNPTPVVNYSGDLTYCDGETVVIDLASNLAGTTFSWMVSENGTTGASSGTGSQISQTVSLTGDSAGTLSYTVIPTLNGCDGTAIIVTVAVNPLPEPVLVDGVICTTSSAPPGTQVYTLDSNLPSAGHTFQWFLDGAVIPDATGNTYDATVVGTYSVIATNASGCVSEAVFAEVSQRPTGESLLVETSGAFSEHPMVSVSVIGADGPFTYQMDNGPMQGSNVFHDVSAGTHLIHVTDGYCTDLISEIIIIDYPKFFTPNGDGFHDTWNVVGLESGTIFIFDRYGKLLKQLAVSGNGWDGTYNGKALPSEDYWFVIDFLENGSARTFKAHFALKR